MNRKRCRVAKPPQGASQVNVVSQPLSLFFSPEAMRYCGFLLRAFYPGICSREKSRFLFFFSSVAFTRELNSLFFYTFFCQRLSRSQCSSVCLHLRLLLRRFSGFLATPGPFSSSFSPLFFFCYCFCLFSWFIERI